MILTMPSDKTGHGVREDFQNTLARNKFDQNNVQAGRGFVKACVEYIHYVKTSHDATAPRQLATLPKPPQLLRRSSTQRMTCRTERTSSDKEDQYLVACDGGYDQGMAFVPPLATKAIRGIAMSRFG